ncbi:Zn-ribbon domain-containing OB-fold protein [Candidatus Poriferisocius sp.]|uniref:Zn-ribbon domain-containing OB-fold protein n=1 Tax=Candidatus Poriferisocius sp. TaxID=3101276 RepID=UPI003B02CEE8
MAEKLRADLVLEYPFTRTTGPVIGAFLTGLREGIVLGIRRPDGTVLCPPTEYDPCTSEPLTELVEVGPEGELVSWTWVSPPRPQSPWDGPHGLGLIRLDGADTTMVHGVLVDDPADMVVGMRVVARWRANRQGHITDLEGFVPSGSPGQDLEGFVPSGSPGQDS